MKPPQEQLRSWFFSSRRSLPWRKDPSPYEVWVSEVMLQQTQVSVVIPYFDRWMRRFPDIPTLASASIEEVIKLWEGLGYYSRARNLHEGARYLVSNHGGVLPSDPVALKKVKGLGPYTIGAVLSFAFKKKAPAVDGNVLRVMSRYYAIDSEIDKGKTRRLIEEKTAVFLPDYEPWIVMEALIELGALVCKKVPNCQICPIKDSCQALRRGLEKKLPITGKKIPVTDLYRFVPVIHSNRSILLKKGGSGEVMADLWEFPYIDLDHPPTNPKHMDLHLQSVFALPLEYLEAMPTVKHGFTRFRASLYPHIYTAPNCFEAPGYKWFLFNDLESLPFSSGHKKIKNQLSSISIFERYVVH